MCTRRSSLTSTVLVLETEHQYEVDSSPRRLVVTLVPACPGTIVVRFEDITERRKLEDDLRFSQIGLRETQRMSKTGSWVWNVTDNEVWHK